MGKICTNCGTENAENNKYCSSCGRKLSTIETTVTSTPAAMMIPPKKKSSGKIVLFILCCVLYYIILGFAIKGIFNSSFFFSKTMIKMAAAVNESCPKMVENDIRLDGVQVLSDNAFQYNFALMALQDDFVDTIVAKAVMEPDIVKMVRTNPEMKILRDHKISLNFCYRRKNGEYFFMVWVTPDQYQD